jgi:hypothetical protein
LSYEDNGSPSGAAQWSEYSSDLHTFTEPSQQFGNTKDIISNFSSSYFGYIYLSCLTDLTFLEVQCRAGVSGKSVN